MGEQVPDLEGLLGELEGETKPVVDALERGEQLKPEEREVLSVFAGLQFARVPATREAISQTAGELAKEMFQFGVDSPERVKELLEKTGEQADPEELYDYIQGGEYSAELVGNYALAWSVGAGLEIGF